MTIPSTDPLKLLTREQVAELLGFSAWTIGQWVRQGSFPKPLKLGPRREHRWKRVDIELWMQREQRKPDRPLRGIVRERLAGTYEPKAKVVRLRLVG